MSEENNNKKEIRVKVSELPSSTDFEGLWTLGVNRFNKSVKVSLNFIKQTIDSFISQFNTAKETTEQATADAKKATESATSAAASATTAASNATTATNNANAATDAAKSATADAQQATAETRQATEDSIAARERLERLVPTGMDVDSYPAHLTYGNVSDENRIEVSLRPDTVSKNVIFISDNKSVAVRPDGQLTIIGRGVSTIHIVPTCNTALYKTIQILVSDPTIRMATRSAMRLTADGSLRLN